MPKLKAGVSVPADFFNVNGLDYPKGNYELAYRDVQGTPPDVILETVLQIGIRQKFSRSLIQNPEIFSDWTDSTDTPYASVSALLTDMNTLGVFAA